MAARSKGLSSLYAGFGVGGPAARRGAPAPSALMLVLERRIGRGPPAGLGAALPGPGANALLVPACEGE